MYVAFSIVLNRAVALLSEDKRLLRKYLRRAQFYRFVSLRQTAALLYRRGVYVVPLFLFVGTPRMLRVLEKRGVELNKTYDAEWVRERLSGLASARYIDVNYALTPRIRDERAIRSVQQINLFSKYIIDNAVIYISEDDYTVALFSKRLVFQVAGSHFAISIRFKASQDELFSALSWLHEKEFEVLASQHFVDAVKRLASFKALSPAEREALLALSTAARIAVAP